MTAEVSTRPTLDSVRVELLDWTKVDEELTELVRGGERLSGSGSDKSYEVDSRFKGLAVREDGSTIVLTDELVGQIMTPNGAGVPVVRVGLFEKAGEGSFAIMPAAEVQLDAEWLAKARTGTEKSAREFMGGRCDYNTRLVRNQETFLRWFADAED